MTTMIRIADMGGKVFARQKVEQEKAELFVADVTAKLESKKEPYALHYQNNGDIVECITIQVLNRIAKV